MLSLKWSLLIPVIFIVLAANVSVMICAERLKNNHDTLWAKIWPVLVIIVTIVVGGALVGVLNWAMYATPAHYLFNLVDSIVNGVLRQIPPLLVLIYFIIPLVVAYLTYFIIAWMHNKQKKQEFEAAVEPEAEAEPEEDEGLPEVDAVAEMAPLQWDWGNFVPEFIKNRKKNKEQSAEKPKKKHKRKQRNNDVPTLELGKVTPVATPIELRQFINVHKEQEDIATAEYGEYRWSVLPNEDVFNQYASQWSLTEKPERFPLIIEQHNNQIDAMNISRAVTSLRRLQRD